CMFCILTLRCELESRGCSSHLTARDEFCCLIILFCCWLRLYMNNAAAPRSPTPATTPTTMPAMAPPERPELPPPDPDGEPELGVGLAVGELLLPLSPSGGCVTLKHGMVSLKSDSATYVMSAQA